MRTLIVVDMQNDFITGALGTPEAKAIVPKVKQKIDAYRSLGSGGRVIFTRDTHFPDYMRTREGMCLPVNHCQYKAHGWEVIEELGASDNECINKYSFGYDQWNNNFLFDEFDPTESIELVGVCTDICVVSNALILKATYPEMNILVDAGCCAGSTPENHKAALQVMRCCQINVVGE